MNLQPLIENIKDQAKEYLNDAREFYPFGANLKPDGTIVSVEDYKDSELL